MVQQIFVLYVRPIGWGKNWFRKEGFLSDNQVCIEM